MADAKEQTKKKSWFWINNTVGKPSMSATFATVAFFATTAAYMASIFEKIGPVSLRQFDAAACSSYMIPILTLYFGRRWTEAKHEKQEDK
jgi:hypothetical protein